MGGSRARAAAAATVVLVLLAAGCGSSKKSTAGGTSSGSTAGTTASTSGTTGSTAGKTITIGVIADLTGLASADDTTVAQGVAARIGLAGQEGYHIKYVVADTASSPATALAAAQRLVDQDHVFAVVLVSALGFSAAPFLLAHNIPVVGAAIDSTEWITDRNMFSILGTEDYTKVSSIWGQIYKQLGATSVASLGYSISPSSAESAKGVAASSQQAGLKVGYLNADFPFGSTNVGPIVLAIKNSGANAFSASVEENTEFAIISQLRGAGADLKVPLLATGYGGDLAMGGPGAAQAAQGVYFLSGFEPVEMNTPATQQLQNALKTYSGVNGDPTFAEYLGYLSVDALVQGLKAAGSNPTQGAVINALQGMDNYTGAGLYGSHSVAFNLAARGQNAGADGCEWITQYQGSTFHLVPGMDPICGSIIPGLKVSASS
jgi:branched-chain amino acid transport system substrate-binding protein